MNIEILAIGTELLMGQISNTNAQYLSFKLPELGYNVLYHSVIGDNPTRLKESLAIASNRADIIITTGGLGPTQDDLSKEIISEFCNRKLVIHEDSLAKIRSFFKELNIEMTQNNEKQALMPENSIILENGAGTAPGCIIENRNKIYIMLPGPPKEMIHMYENKVIPYLKNKSEGKLISKYFRIFGIGESKVENKLINMFGDQSKLTFATYAKDGEVLIRISSKISQSYDADDEIKKAELVINNILGDSIYSNIDEELEATVGRMLIEKNISISTAESCTGGLVASKLTNVSGISKVFKEGIVTYSNESKMAQLGVKEKTLIDYGAVSSQTAIEMAEGLRKKSNVDIALSVTGIAGPNGGTKDKPVGLVYFGISSKFETSYFEIKTFGDRNRIRVYSTLMALDIIRKHIMKYFK